MSLVTKAVSNKFSKEKKISLLKECVPFVAKTYIPIFYSTKKQTLKFTPIHDQLLLNGLKKFSSKNLKMIKKLYLPFKEMQEIKNRFKNLTRFKSSNNIIKNWKILEIAPLAEDEK